MKNFVYKLLAVALVLGTAAGCDPAENASYDVGDGYVQLNAVSAAFNENGTGITVEVALGLVENTSGVTVNFDVVSADPSRYTVSPANGVLEFAAGESFQTIEIVPVDNLDADGNLDVNITLTGASDGLNLGVGGLGSERVSGTYEILDNDCPFTMADFAGTYSVAEVFTGGANAGLTLAGAFGETYQITLSVDPTDTTDSRLIVSNTGPNVYLGLSDGTVITLDASESTCVGPFALDPSPPAIALFAFFNITSTSFDTTAKTFTADGTLGNFGPYQFVFTKD
jgi:hypothetical protein